MGKASLAPTEARVFDTRFFFLLKNCLSLDMVNSPPRNATAAMEMAMPQQARYQVLLLLLATFKHCIA